LSNHIYPGLFLFSYSSFADKFLIIAADREFIPTTPEAVRIFAEVFASVDDSLPPLLSSKDRPWWHVEFPLSPMADPWIPAEEAMAISAGIRPCVVQVDCVDCAMTGEGKSTCSSAQPDPAVAKWKCLLCPKKCEWASQLHNHVKEWHLFLHNYFLEGRMPSFENCIHCRKLLCIYLSSLNDFLDTIILIFPGFPVSLTDKKLVTVSDLMVHIQHFHPSLEASTERNLRVLVYNKFGLSSWPGVPDKRV
jgi:hypothetical protein